MILHEELFIIVNGERRKIQIKIPSGITLKFQSNMFKDLSKFCASYSYTFKIPKTKDNIEAFDLVDDIRYSSSVYGKKMECEFYRDGIKLFDNSYLYISEAAEHYSAVMTWNVLSWLLEISEDGKSIKDIERNLGGSQLTSVAFGGNLYNITYSQRLDNPSISAVYRCGTPFVAGRIPNLVPIRYLLNKIARFYGKEDATKIFSFMRQSALTNMDISRSATKFHIAEDGVIPLVSGKWSNAYLQTQIRKSDKQAAEKYQSEFPTIDMFGNEIGQQIGNVGVLYLESNKQFVRFGDPSGSTDYVSFLRQTGTATNNDTSLGVESNNWTFSKEDTGLYIGFKPKNASLPLIVRGRMRLTDSVKVRFVPFKRQSGSVYKYAPTLDSYGEIEDGIEIQATPVEGSNNLYEVNFDPEQGGTEVEIESKEGVEFWGIQIVGYAEVFISDGYIKFMPNRENISFYPTTPLALNNVDLFNNLPDIKIIDLLKSIFYIENAYPVIDKDGRIGQMRYEDLYNNIESGNVYDWSDLLVGESKNDTIKYTYDTLGRVNRFNMKNYSSSKEEENETALRYDDATAFFPTLNESINAENTIFTFPFSSAAKVTKDGFSAGDTFIFWEYDPEKCEYKAAGSVAPIIGRVRSYSEESISIASSVSKQGSRSLKFDIWQVAGQIYNNTPLAKILRKPYVITTQIFIDTYTLSTIDFTKPVYLQRYNSYFGIVSIQCNSNGISKAELIKIPTDTQSSTIVEDPEVSITGSPILYKKSGESARARFDISASVKGSRINRMVVKLDGEQIEDANFEAMTITTSFDYGTHTLEVTAYSMDGRSKTEYYETIVNYAAEKVSVDFIDFTPYLTISKSSRNVATYAASVYNTTQSGTMKIYKKKEGSDQSELVAQGSGKTISFNWSFYEQLAQGVSAQNWVLTASFVNSSGVEIATNSKNVLVSVDRNLLKSYYGVVSGMYFQTGSNSLYKEGSSIHNIFGSGDYEASYMVLGGQIDPYYVEIHFKCYPELTGSATYEYIHRIDPYNGYSDSVKLKQSEFGQYKRIEVTASAYYYDSNNTKYYSRSIWLYRD